MSEKKKVEKIFKTFRSIVKKIGEGDDEGIIDVLIPMSTISTDRHGESIDPKAWKKSLKEFKKRSILMSSHNYSSIQNQIGEVLDIQVTEEGLLARPKYYINQGNPEADWAYFIASKGMAAYSVGFIPIKWTDSKDEPFRTYTEAELIELSHVTVPSNRDAIMGLQAKGIDDPVILKIVDEIIEDKEFFKPSKEEGPEDVKKIIKEGLKGVKTDPINPDRIKASMEKDEREEKLKDIGLFDVRELADIVNENKELKEKIKDLELKAGAVLNTKNKGDLKKAQKLNQESDLLIQAVLDSAGEKEGLEDEGGEEKDTKKDDTVITITEDKKEDPGKDEKTDKKTVTIVDWKIAEAVTKALNYQLGIVGKIKK